MVSVYFYFILQLFFFSVHIWLERMTYYTKSVILKCWPCYFSVTGGEEDSTGQRYSADPTGLLGERTKGEKEQDGYPTALRDKNNTGYFDSFESNREHIIWHTHTHLSLSLYIFIYIERDIIFLYI